MQSWTPIPVFGKDALPCHGRQLRKQDLGSSDGSFGPSRAEEARQPKRDTRRLPDSRCVLQSSCPRLLFLPSLNLHSLDAAKRWHPDLNPGCDKATSRFQSITDAYESAMQESKMHAASAASSSCEGFGFRSASGFAFSARRPFNPQAQQRAYATMGSFDDAYFRHVQASMRRAQQQDSSASGPQSKATGHETRKSDGAAWAWHAFRRCG